MAAPLPVIPDAEPELVWLNPVEGAPCLPTDEAELLVLANRLLAHLGDLEAERTANADACKRQLQALEARYQRLDEPLARRVAGIMRTLEAIHLQLPQRGKAKSRKLAFGVIGTRTKAPRVEVTDPPAVMQAVRENAPPDVVDLIVRRVTTDKLDHRALTSYVAGHGWAELPGTVVHKATETFYAEADAS